MRVNTDNATITKIINAVKDREIVCLCLVYSRHRRDRVSVLDIDEFHSLSSADF